MVESELDRISRLESEVAELRVLVKELSTQLAKLDRTILPSDTRVRVIGSMRDRIARSMKTDSD